MSWLLNPGNLLGAKHAAERLQRCWVHPSGQAFSIKHLRKSFKVLHAPRLPLTPSVTGSISRQRLCTHDPGHTPQQGTLSQIVQPGVSVSHWKGEGRRLASSASAIAVCA